MIILSFLVLVSCYLIMKACDPFEQAADFLGRNMTAGIKGATINAVASSIPELLTTVIFLFFYHDKAGFASGIGTTAGSAVFNAMVIPAMCIFAVLLFLKSAQGFNLSRNCILRDGFFLIIAEIVLIIILSGKILSWWHGLIMIGIYVVYAVFMYGQHMMLNKNKPCDEDEDTDEIDNNTSSALINFIKFDYRNMLHRNKKFSSKTAFIALGISIFFITLACWILAECVIKIAEHYYMNTFFVAVVVAAAATSVPDTVISFKDAIKGNYDDSISNAVGSNIFDICICLGLPLFIYALFFGSIEIPQSAGVAELRIILLALTIVVIFTLLFPKKLGYVTAGMFFSGYIFYATFSWCRGLGYEWAVQISVFIQNLFQLT